jgi:hypothetical protein
MGYIGCDAGGHGVRCRRFLIYFELNDSIESFGSCRVKSSRPTYFSCDEHAVGHRRVTRTLQVSHSL